MDLTSYLFGVVTIPAILGGYVLFVEVLKPMVEKRRIAKADKK